eukprot:jgi/Undpi1/5752/HiC_scaffold_2.g01026.m1
MQLLAVLWVAVTIVFIPKELAGIKQSFSNQHTGDDAGATSPTGVNAQGGLWENESVAPPKRVRPDSNRPRGEISMEEITSNMRSFLSQLNSVYKDIQGPEPLKIWDLYKQATDEWLMPMDRDFEGQTLFDVKKDDSVFVSVASYRDENCPTTLKEMYSKADHPEKLFIGLVQQNCESNCRTGVLEGGVVEDTEPDINCYEVFCGTELGSEYCQSGNVRNFLVDEADALGPAVARYFASKLWQGETFFMQIDAHSLFETSWDTMLIDDILNTPSYPRSVLSHYPPDTKVVYQHQPGYRICGAEFAQSPVEYDIIRLGPGIAYDKGVPSKPCYAPFVGAGFFFAHASFLADVPFDPYVPWVFMGEEILLSLRFWTWGYDIFSPTKNVLSHFYVRRHTPKFWETVSRLFRKPSIHNELTSYIINRVKNIAGYPESSEDILLKPTLLAHLELYGDGDVRAMEDYMAIVGLDMVSKRKKDIQWCTKCQTPYPL